MQKAEQKQSIRKSQHNAVDAVGFDSAVERREVEAMRYDDHRARSAWAQTGWRSTPVATAWAGWGASGRNSH